MKNIRVLTGVTTSGKPHIGNLCGAILPAIKESKIEGVDSFLFLADYHSLIKHKNPELTHLPTFWVPENAFMYFPSNTRIVLAFSCFGA